MKRFIAMIMVIVGIFTLYKLITIYPAPSPMKVSTTLGYDRPDSCKDLGEEQIKWMQAALNRCIEAEGLNAESLEVDGHFGPASQKATAAFQQAADLPEDGCLNAVTVQTMIHILDDGKVGFGSEDTIRWTLETGNGNATLAKNETYDGAELTIDYSTDHTDHSRSTTITVTDEQGNTRQITLSSQKAP